VEGNVGLNLGTDSQKEAVQEAAAVLGSSLQSFQISNEVENLRHRLESYHATYVDYKSGIRAMLASAAFSGPNSVGGLALRHELCRHRVPGYESF
jgi:hypothetical protein